jgi:NTE family protein
MKTSDFTKDKEVQEIILNLRRDLADKLFSDVVDREGNQYVDLVQEGGGVLGIALLGYTYVLEQVGIRFFSLAGTSAGAINTLLLAAVDPVEKPKSEKIIELIANKNLFDFVDGPFFAKFLLKALRTNKEDESLLKKIIKKTLIVLWTLIWIIPVVIYLFIRKGLNRGKNFRNWIVDILKENRINSYSDLSKIRRTPENISIRSGVDNTTVGLKPNLKIIAAEITTESRIIFPEMNVLFWNEPGNENPADYLRASMSIPLFFHPFRLDVGNMNKEDWQKQVKFHGNPPAKACFVDGGILSNFPIDVFHNRNIIPRLPTFGVKLGDDRNKTTKVKSLMKFLMAIFNSARHVLDYQFLLKNDDYEQLIQKIDIGEHNWLNFSMPDKDKLDLFKRGAIAANQFLRKFKWEKYKETRAKMVKRN